MTALRWGEEGTMVRPLVLKFLSGFSISFRGFSFFLPSRRLRWPNTSDGERERWMAGPACKSVPSTSFLPLKDLQVGNALSVAGCGDMSSCLHKWVLYK